MTVSNKKLWKPLKKKLMTSPFKIPFYTKSAVLVGENKKKSQSIYENMI